MRITPPKVKREILTQRLNGFFHAEPQRGDALWGGLGMFWFPLVRPKSQVQLGFQHKGHEALPSGFSRRGAEGLLVFWYSSLT